MRARVSAQERNLTYDQKHLTLEIPQWQQSLARWSLPVSQLSECGIRISDEYLKFGWRTCCTNKQEHGTCCQNGADEMLKLHCALARRKGIQGAGTQMKLPRPTDVWSRAHDIVEPTSLGVDQPHIRLHDTLRYLCSYWIHIARIK